MTPENDLRTHTANQRVAADPAASAWVAANAGSGKTRVLVDRVTRLLLQGTRPSGILCLTFTKAAAAEMQLRLTARLGKWTTLDEAVLTKDLHELLGHQVTAGDMEAARRLFARTLEAPGGLRLQTVHAFCEALLKRFPVEANVPPGFAVADEPVTAELFATAQTVVLGEGLQDAGFRPVIDFFAASLDDTRFTALLKTLLGRRRDLALLLAEGGADAAIGRLYAQLDLAPDAARDAVIHDYIRRMDRESLRRAVSALCSGGKTDQKIGRPLADWLAADCLAETFEEMWLTGFFTAEGKPRASMASKQAIAIAADCADLLAEEQTRLTALQQTLNALAIAEGTAMLLRLGERMLAVYTALKAERGLLDYDDLILKSRDLLVEPSQVPWVMFKLDQGIDHILVDEAQDTSPDQWSVIAALAEEFFSGTGARDGLPRTVFAVGDVKQSIYSFQGARPQAFLDMRRAFERRANAVGERLAAVPLEMSFRSAPAILQLVDTVFAQETAQGGVVQDGVLLSHKASRSEAAGRIELWPPFKPDPKAQSEPWDAPLDYVGQKDPRVRLAEAIAAQIRHWMDHETLPNQGRRLKAGDVMILVRRRNVFFEAMVQALKAANVPVAGADRMRLAEQVAVQDLLALGRFCLLPQDDLTLATILKGPLFGFSEEDLFALCWNRGDKVTVWQTLLQRAGEHPHWTAALDELRALLNRADLVPPFTFYAELLGAGGGRRRLIARLGPQANEPVDEFLAATLAHEREEAPSLQGFISWFPRHAGEVKRDLDQGRDEVRVLTVHGAKGLEAPVVILPDTCDLPMAQGDEGLLWGEAPADSAAAYPAAGPAAARAVPQLYWPRSKDNDVGVTSGLRSLRQTEQMAEYRRLLYVALTRARDRLYVCGYLNSRTAEKGPPSGCWYDLVANGFDRLQPHETIALAPEIFGEIDAARYETFPLSRGKPEPEAVATPVATVPDWLHHPPPPDPTPPKPLTPSRPSRSEPPPLSPMAADRLAGLKRGQIIHRLLQTLPELPDDEARITAATRFLAHPAHGLTPLQQSEIQQEVLAVLHDAAFAAIFTPASVSGARVEAPLAGRVGNRMVAGQVDRLLVTDSIVMVVDYKTNRPPPLQATDVDPAYLDQMALYCALLRQVFPGREIQAALLWTHAPRLMLLPANLLDQRLAAFTAT